MRPLRRPCGRGGGDGQFASAAFCQGVKVCFEIVLMATDSGLAASGEKVIAIAGTGWGSDTALVM
jgi:hypothetical protein